MTQHVSVSSMPTDWWKWDGDKLYPLGICEDFDEASEKADAPGLPAHWIFSRESLELMRDQINEELNHG